MPKGGARKGAGKKGKFAPDKTKRIQVSVPSRHSASIERLVRSWLHNRYVSASSTVLLQIRVKKKNHDEIKAKVMPIVKSLDE